MKKLPIGKKDFKNIIEDNFLYIDKTKYLHSLITTGTYYFISRPRRFGKSLLISTLENIFKGNKELFHELYIYDKWEFNEYPVIKIDFNQIQKETPELFKKNLLNRLNELAVYYQIQLNYADYKESFAELIIKLSNINKVVILIDEYDKPIIDTLTDIEHCKINREILKNFYGTIKALDEYIQFTLLTGVSKFSKTSIFSDLNNLNDLTMHPRYNEMLGYTQSELEYYFKDRINFMIENEKSDRNSILQKIKKWYNGYNWSGKETLYNPFSILKFFDSYVYSNYWFETGTPKFLVDLIYHKRYNLPKLENLILSEMTFSKFDIENIGVEALLFQTGYLTIQKIITDINKNFYKLYFPNQEVKDSLLDILFKKYISEDNGDYDFKFTKMRTQLLNDDIDGFFDNIKMIFSGIPYEIFINKEDYYSSVIYTILAMTGITANFEVMTNLGRLDCAIDFGKKVFIFEFKLNQTAEKAIEQIKTNKYHEKWNPQISDIYLIGVEFSSKERNVSNYIYKKL